MKGNTMDSVDRGCQSVLVMLAAIMFGSPFLFGSCWLLTWFFKPGYQDLAMTSGYGSLTPYIAGGITFVSFLAFSFIYSKLHEYDND
jgi:hypothetical protein